MAAEPRLAAAARIGRLQVAAVLEGTRLLDLRLDDPALAGPRPGEIWAARVDRLAPGQGAAFLSLGEAAAYLPDAAGLAPGERILVEIQRWPERIKAAQANRKLTFRGRLMAHTPSAPGMNLSRRIADAAERERLAAALAPFATAGGYVLRTAAAGAEPEDLAAEAERLAGEAAALASLPLDPPRRLRPAADPLAQIAWEWTPERRIGGFDDPAEGAALFDSLGLFETIDALCEPRVGLGSAGWMALERTEALIAVDVNSGGGEPMRANLAAAAEIPRQLRLRGWGGMALIDFAPASEPDRRRIEQALRRAADAALKPAGWGPLGLLEATRRRDRLPLEALWRSRESEMS